MAFKKIVITIDYTHPTGPILKNMGETLKSMFTAEEIKRAKLVSIMNWGEYSFDGNPDPKVKKEVLADVKKALEKADKTLGLGLESKLIEHTGRTTKSNVKALVDFLIKTKADLVVAGTKNKKGLGTYFFGSFVEELSFQVPCALLTVHPETKVKKSKAHYLLTHDLREDYKATLPKVIKIAQKGSHVTLFHHFEMGIGKRSPEYVHELLNLKNERAHEIQTALAKKDVEVDIVIDTKTGNTYQHIIECAKEVGATHIVTTAKVEKLGNFFIGSTARKLLKTSKVPVLIIHA